MPSREHRKFGIEIECYNLSSIPEEIRTLGWIIGYDGSISGSNAYEIKSPPLPATTESFRQVKQVMRLIRSVGGRVNRTCGMHVHIGIEDDVRNKCVPGLFFETMLRRYSLLENFTDNLVPPSRRGNVNGYCRSTNDLVMRNANFMTSMHAANTVETARHAMGYVGRGYKLNITAFIRHGTVEIRHFGGTLNGTKAVAWIKFCLAFVNVCSNASLRDVSVRRTYTERQWSNPLLGIVSERTRNRLRTRHDRSLSASR